MTVARLKASLHDRVAALEERSEVHEKTISPMAQQVDEMYLAWTRLQTLNWFRVKIAGGIMGALGGIAVLLTIVEKVWQFAGHH